MAQTHPSLTAGFVTLAGVRLEIAQLPAAAGQPARAPLVFLHEGLGSVAMWRQRERFWPGELCAATGRSGLLYSRRGYGQSDAIVDVRGPSGQNGFWRHGRHRADYMHVEAFEVLPQLLAACGIERPILVGHSDGATIALLYASRHPVTACVVMAPHVIVEDICITAIEQARDAYQTTPLRERLARYHRDVDNAFWQWNDVWLSEPFRHFDIRRDCAHIRSPLLLIQGRDDEYGTLRQLDEIQQQAPQAQRLELAHCGHSPHRDQPEAVTAAICDFLRNQP